MGAVSRKPDTFSFFPAAGLCLTYTAKGYVWNAPLLPTLPHFSRLSWKQLSMFHLNREAFLDFLGLILSKPQAPLTHKMDLLLSLLVVIYKQVTCTCTQSIILFSICIFLLFNSIRTLASGNEVQLKDKATPRGAQRSQAQSIPGLSAGGVSKSRI